MRLEIAYKLSLTKYYEDHNTGLHRCKKRTLFSTGWSTFFLQQIVMRNLKFKLVSSIKQKKGDKRGTAEDLQLY